MPSDPDPLLNRLVVASLTVFVMVSLLMAAFVTREIWLQQQITGLSSSVQVNLEDLEETTEEIQHQLDEIHAGADNAQEGENSSALSIDSSGDLTRQATQLEDITELLDDVDAQLDSLEKEIGDVAQMVEPDAVDLLPATAGGADESAEESAQPDRIDQVFTIFALLVGVAGIAIAILLGMALRVQQRVAWRESATRIGMGHIGINPDAHRKNAR